MKKGKFAIEIELDNGTWKCEYEGFAHKGAPRFHISITPPDTYKPLDEFEEEEGGTETAEFIYDEIMLSFNFDIWPWLFQDDNYGDQIEQILSTYLMRRIMWDEEIEKV